MSLFDHMLQEYFRCQTDLG